ncbi:MAG: XdhC family protein [Ignavibacteria bacterium]
MKQLDFWNEIKENIVNHKKLSLAIVFDADHSTPGRQGFKMYVTPDGNVRGSVGGGLVESMVMDECKANLRKEAVKNYFKEFKLLGKAEESIGMICNGVQIIGFLVLEEKHLPLITGIIESVKSHKEGYIKITENDFKYVEESIPKDSFNREEFIYSERVGVKNKVYIFGGGHVGLAISRVMSQLDFYVIVIDSRKDVNTLVENTFADEIVIKDFVEATNDIIEDKFSYVVIVTPGHIQDKGVLKAVLNKNVKYIGMMGSASKVGTVYKELVAEGINPNYLSRVHSPIGIKIKSETPEEIAISIAAEIIGIKNAIK